VRGSRAVIGAAAVTLGAALGGVLGEWIGLRATVLVAASGGALAFVWLLVSPLAMMRGLPEPAE
jgi:predicted MFS family arabinose efflux permease